MVYMVTFAINIPRMLAYIPYMDPSWVMGLVENPSTKITHMISSDWFMGNFEGHRHIFHGKKNHGLTAWGSPLALCLDLVGDTN